MFLKLKIGFGTHILGFQALKSVFSKLGPLGPMNQIATSDSKSDDEIGHRLNDDPYFNDEIIIRLKPNLD